MSRIEQLAHARVFDLEQPRFAGMPVHPAHTPGYFYGLRRRHRDSCRPGEFGLRSGSSGVLTMMEHSGTHVDALCRMAWDNMVERDRETKMALFGHAHLLVEHGIQHHREPEPRGAGCPRRFTSSASSASR